MKLLLAAALFTIAFSACAQTTPNSGQSSVAIYSPGSLECGDYLSGREKGYDVQGVANYAWGFLSAGNFYNRKSQAHGNLSSGTITAYIDKYCRDNPLDTLFPAIVGLGRSLGLPPSHQ